MPVRRPFEADNQGVHALRIHGDDLRFRADQLPGRQSSWSVRDDRMPVDNHRQQAGTPATSRPCWPIAPAMLLRHLPSLGSVLYLPLSPSLSLIEEPTRGLLVETMRLAPLLRTRYLAAASVITSEGPREWIDCVDRLGQRCARLYLLPDTDYLAWDALSNTTASMTSTAPAIQHASVPRHTKSASAHVLRFHWRQLAGLDVLSAEAATQVSALSEHLIGQVAAAEAVPLRHIADA